jgi:hypothetical protein
MNKDKLKKTNKVNDETFLDRLIKEKNELAEKLDKLTSFLNNKEKAISISGHKQYEYLCLQKDVMAEYHDILVDRIRDLGSSPRTNA